MSPAGSGVVLVIPTWNRCRWVTEAVESVLVGQVVPEIVVVDDGSTDGTATALRERFGAEITVLEQENAERGAARNHGVWHSTAELILFLDADDLVLRDHVSELVRLAEANPTVELFHTPFEVADEKGTPTGRGGGPVGRHSHEAFVLGQVQIPPSVMAIRRSGFERVGGFDERRELAGSEDWLLVAEALRTGPSLCGERPTVRMRKHAGNSMGNARSMEASMLLAHELHFDAHDPEGADNATITGLRSRSRAALLVNAATTWFAAGDAGEARRCLRAAVRESPGVVRDLRVSSTFLKTVLGVERVDQIKEWLDR